MLWRKNDWDQVLFGQVLGKGSGGRTVDRDRLRPMYKRKDGTHVMAGVLPVSLFASGHTFFVSRMAHLMHQHPYMVHTDLPVRRRAGQAPPAARGDDVGGRGRVLLRLQARTSSCTSPMGTCRTSSSTRKAARSAPTARRTSTCAATSTSTLPSSTTSSRRSATASRSRRHSAAILILPRLVCGLDRWWAPHSGIIPGSAARLPLLECPADHVIDLERMGKPERVLREQTLLVQPAHARERPRVDGDGRGRRLAARSTPTVERGRAARRGSRSSTRLKNDYATRRCESSTLPPDYRALPAAERAVDDFEATMRATPSLWCCNRPPGGARRGYHIWYDFLSDVIPHRTVQSQVGG